jgi:hypothetical protein
MSKPTDKINFSDITFDGVIGDGIEPTGSTDSGDNLDNDVNDQDDDDLVDDNDDDQDDQDDNRPAKRSSRDDNDDDDFDDDDDSNNSDSSSVAASIAQALGYELENEYEDSEEGLVELTKDIAQNIAEDQLQELFGQYPLLQQHMEFLLAGGESEKFFEAYNPNSDYATFEISKDDLRSQKGFVAEYFRNKGHDEEFVKEMIEEFEDSGKLYVKALVAQKHLAAVQEKTREQLIIDQKRQQAEAAAQQEEFWEEVASTISSGNEFAGIRFPDREKAKFFEYISEPKDQAGRTQRDVDYANADLEVKLAIDYLMYKGMNLSDIIQTKAKTESVKSLRDKIQSHQDRVKNFGKVDKNGNRKFDPDQLDMKRLFE